MCAHVLDHQERGGRHGGHEEADEDGRARPAVTRRGDEPVGEPGKKEHGQPGSEEINVAGRRGVPRLWHVTGGHEEDHDSHREVDEEHPSPRCGNDQVAAQQRTGRCGHAPEPRPCTDGPRPVVGPERGLQDGQARRSEEGATDALEDSGPR